MPGPGDADTWGAATTRAAALTFGAVVVVGTAAIRWISRDIWFDIDDWGFLAGRGANPDDLLESWNQHWCTVPILAYRVLWRLVGIDHFWHYQALTIACHVASACLVRLVARRAGAHPWVATAAAALFLLLGAGYENIVRSFQITFAGSLAFGLAHLVLADHDGPLDRRDAAGLACGLVGLMCSGIAVTMVAVVGLATLLRRGWRVAAVHTVPLAALYAAWWRAYRGEAAEDLPTPGPGDLVAFTVDLVATTFDALGQVPGVGVALAAGAIAGALLLLRREGPRPLRHRLAAPLALALGSVPLGASIAWGRGAFFGGRPPMAPRYVHLAAALLLPAVVVGLTELARRGRPALLAVVALLVVGIPANVGQLEPERPTFYDLVPRDLVLSVAELAETSPADPGLHPLSAGGSPITVGWLQDGRATGRIPDPPAGTTPAVRARAALALSLLPVDDLGGRRCSNAAPGAVEVQRGDRLRIRATSVTLVRVLPAGEPAGVLLYTNGEVQGSPVILVTVEDGPLTLRLDPPAPVERCR